MVGGDHATGAGGFSAGGGDGSLNGRNGFGSSDNRRDSYGTGGGYFSKGTGYQKVDIFFGQGGAWQGADRSDDYYWYGDYSGSGGEAGSGGEIYYLDSANIYAFNGDRITDNNYNDVVYEFDVDGNKTQIVAEVKIKEDGSQFIPTNIFSQDGTIREVYKTNQAMTDEECTKYGVSPVVKDKCKESQTVNVKIKERELTPKTAYGQGIGSGAGYIEKSNGIFNKFEE